MAAWCIVLRNSNRRRREAKTQDIRHRTVRHKTVSCVLCLVSCVLCPVLKKITKFALTKQLIILLYRSMKSHHWKYLLVYITPLLVFISIYLGGLWSFLAIGYVFVLVPFLELFLKGTTINLDPGEEEIAKNDRFYDYVIYGLVPCQLGLLIFFLFRLEDQTLMLWEKLGLMTAMGISCGTLGINAAHELGHRKTRYEQILSKILLATTLYMHFFIEHNRGHHKNVSTAEDPASSRFGESLYAFYYRSVKDSWLSAWRLERDRLQKKQQSFWSYHNEMLLFQIIQLAIVVSILAIFGWDILLFYLGASVIGFLLLETVNYIEHYGLTRLKNENGFYEPTKPVHSWNSNHALGRILLLELTRHSDHHYMSTRKYQVLRHFDESPQMPTGYPGMILLSFIPSLWFWVMHRQIEKYRKSKAGNALA
jgi:alkane 1-monooxygenase